MKILYSNIDKSVNFVEDQLTGFIESRYVRRTNEYFSAYLSSQTGCNRGCLMCHLTATKQTMFTNCDLLDFINQFESILTHYNNHIESNGPAKWVSIQFMARGEPLANPTITETSTELLLRLGNMAKDKNLQVKFNISTIMPITLKKTLVQIFPIITPTIYYSMYSVNSNFRNKWLPASMDVNRALELLAEYQRVSKKIIKFHGAFIKDENDHEKDVNSMIGKILQYGIRGEFNIVRYNPYSIEQGEESPLIDEIHSQISQCMPCKIIPKVGEDVHASCGTFVGKSK